MDQAFEKKSYPDELDNWFSDPDEKTIEIIKTDLIPEEDSPTENMIASNPENNMDDDPVENTRHIYIEDILVKDVESLSSYELIQDECSIAYFIQVLMEGSGNSRVKSSKVHDEELTMDKLQSIVEYLQWISKTCEILAKRIGQELLVHQANRTPSIVRSSYNFCNKNTQCKNFYSKNVSPTCKEHHYVHSILKYDVDSVIQFLNFVIQNNITITDDELKNLYLSIKTICFVTRHMAKEISHIHYITINNSEVFHRNNPIEIVKRKVAIKKNWNDDQSEPSKFFKRNYANDNYRKSTNGFTHHLNFRRSYFDPNFGREEKFSNHRSYDDKNQTGSFRKTSNFNFNRQDKKSSSNLETNQQFLSNRYSILAKN